MIDALPRREREVFETLCRLEAGTTAEVRAALADPLSDSAVRTLLARLESKGLVERSTGAHGVAYRPAQATETVAVGALLGQITDGAAAAKPAAAKKAPAAKAAAPKAAAAKAPAAKKPATKAPVKTSPKSK